MIYLSKLLDICINFVMVFLTKEQVLNLFKEAYEIVHFTNYVNRKRRRDRWFMGLSPKP